MPKSQDPLYDDGDDIKWTYINDFMKILELPLKLVASMRLRWILKK